jgi:predicted  nucleic acid-binding Zn-ribbon protein
MITQCPKCGHQRSPLDDTEIPDTQCPACGIYYFKFLNQKSGAPTPQVSPIITAQASETKKRISITAQQAKTEAGAQLLELCQEVTDDGQLSDEEIAAIRHWLIENSAAELPAIAFLTAAVSDYFNPDSSNFCYRKPLYHAIEAVMPISERKQAADRRKDIEAAEKLRLREEKKQEREQEKQRKKEDKERNLPVLHANFMTAGCKYENRPALINRHVEIGDSVTLQRDKNNQFSRFAVKIMTQSGHQIGFVPEVYAKEIAKALDDNTKYDAVFTKILGYDFPIPVVDVDFFRPDADYGVYPSEERIRQPEQPATTPPPSDTQRMLAYQELSTHKTNHILHLLLSLFTVGFWLIPWFIVSANNTGERNKIRKKYGLPIESDVAGLIIKLIFGLWLIGLLFRVFH